MACTHKTLADHSVQSGDRRLWTCSNCGVAGTWTEAWGYFGTIECLRCWTARIDFVHCSDACKAALAAKHGLEVKPTKPTTTPTTTRAPKAPRPKSRPAWERKARAAGWKPPTEGGAS